MIENGLRKKVAFKSVRFIRESVAAFFLCMVVSNVRAEETLGSLVVETLLSHPSSIAQLERLEGSREDIEAAKWQYLATPSISISRVGKSNSAQYISNKQVSKFSLNQPIWTGGRLSTNLNKAETQSAIEEINTDIVKQDLTLQVLSAWSELISANSSVNVFEQSKDIHVKLLEMVKRRFIGGASARSDFNLAQTRLDIALADLEASRLRVLVALSRLEALVGRKLNINNFNFDISIFPKLSDYEATLNQAVKSSPELAKSMAELKLSTFAISAARASMMPQLNLRAERQYGDYYGDNSHAENVIFLEFDMPFDAGLSSFSKIRSAESLRRAAEQQVNVQRLILQQKLHSDFSLLNSSRRREVYLESSLRKSQEVYKSWERQFLVGKRQWPDLMNSAREEAELGAQLAEVKATAYLAAWRIAVISVGPGILIGDTKYVK